MLKNNWFHDSFVLYKDFIVWLFEHAARQWHDMDTKKKKIIQMFFFAFLATHSSFCKCKVYNLNKIEWAHVILLTKMWAGDWHEVFVSLCTSVALKWQFADWLSYLNLKLLYPNPWFSAIYWFFSLSQKESGDASFFLLFFTY